MRLRPFAVPHDRLVSFSGLVPHATWGTAQPVHLRVSFSPESLAVRSCEVDDTDHPALIGRRPAVP
jgi:hypothetical protein